MKYLMISNSGPLDGHKAKENLDMALAMGVFDLDVSMLFTGKSALCWLESNAQLIGKKNISAQLKALPLYGIESIFMQRQDLATYQISEDDLPDFITLLDATQTSSFFASFDRILSI